MICMKKLLKVFLFVGFLACAFCSVQAFATDNYDLTKITPKLSPNGLVGAYAETDASGNAYQSGEKVETAFNDTFARIRIIVMIFSGICTLTAILFLIINVLKLGSSGDNPIQRKAALISIVFSGLGLALLGSVFVVVAFFYRLFT